jgi:tRNA(fMet)-specific endonuclease VapC
MSFLIDTDICSAYIKAHPAVWNRFLQYSGQLHVSVITVAELTTWECRANAPAKRAQEVQDLLQNVVIHEVTADMARHFGQFQAALMDSGQPAPEMDLLIAATALLHGFTLVTHNTADYANIPGLSFVDWLTP